MLRSAGEIARPVDVVRLLRRGGLSLRRAHHVLQTIVDGGAATVEVLAEDVDMLLSEFAGLNVEASTSGQAEPLECARA